MATPTNLPSAFSDNTVLTAAALNNVRGAFRILQIVQAGNTTLTVNDTSTYATTGIAATITPSATSNKVLVWVNLGGCGKSNGNSSSHFYVRVMRGTTDIGLIEGAAGYQNLAQTLYVGNITGLLLDSPSTTTATTYTVEFKNNVNAPRIERSANSTYSSIVLAEVSA